MTGAGAGHRRGGVGVQQQAGGGGAGGAEPHQIADVIRPRDEPFVGEVLGGDAEQSAVVHRGQRRRLHGFQQQAEHPADGHRHGGRHFRGIAEDHVPQVDLLQFQLRAIEEDRQARLLAELGESVGEAVPALGDRLPGGQHLRGFAGEQRFQHGLRLRPHGALFNNAVLDRGGRRLGHLRGRGRGVALLSRSFLTHGTEGGDQQRQRREGDGEGACEHRCGNRGTKWRADERRPA
ncbi:hypothetical protein LzC2_33630 [Planctomycetes bacterium LzC2]|uniref:Uncharacterized protein n=1 Tax=Alienimonas chondri TaxID=2681879 RepID=A0ABX1VHE2_9PLAN|nr:hypothetical protein [Alienimonas chondri]